MKKLSAYLKSPKAARLVSLFFALYFGVAEAGRTKNYWSGIEAIALYWAVWMMGVHSAEHKESP